MTLDYGLYLVTEESVPLPRLLHTVEEAVRGGVTVVQLREKRSDGRVFFEKAMRLKRLLDAYDIPLIINDRVDVALAVQAAGVHVGQDDLPLPAVRKCVPASMIVGVSARTAAQAQAAAAYIAQLDQAKVFDDAIVTRIEPDRAFYPAEAYHQDFLTRNPTHPYIVFNDLPKIEALKRLFPDLYRTEPVLVAASAAGARL